MILRACPDCGASLVPGERCECLHNYHNQKSEDIMEHLRYLKDRFDQFVEAYTKENGVPPGDHVTAFAEWLISACDRFYIMGKADAQNCKRLPECVFAEWSDNASNGDKELSKYVKNIVSEAYDKGMEAGCAA